MSQQVTQLKPLFLSEEEAMALLNLCMTSHTETRAFPLPVRVVYSRERSADRPAAIDSRAVRCYTPLMEPQPALITHNVVAMRAAPRGDSELVSQAILGDNALLLAEDGDYA